MSTPLAFMPWASSLIENCFLLVDASGQITAKEIANYLLTGKDEQVPEQLKALGERTLIKAGLWVPLKYKFYLNDDEKKLVDQVLISFDRLYNSSLFSDMAFVRRWAAVMLACMDIDNMPLHCSSRVPNWLRAILYGIYSHTERFEIPNFWQSQWIFEVFKTFEIDLEIGLSFLLDKEIEYYNRLFMCLHQFNKTTNWIELLQKHQAFDLQKLSVSARSRLVSLLEQEECLEPVIQKVVLLICDRNKQVREEAKSLIKKICPKLLIRTIETHYPQQPPGRRKVFAQFIAHWRHQDSIKILNNWAQSETKTLKEYLLALIKQHFPELNGKKAEPFIPKFQPLNETASWPAAWMAQLTHQLLLEFDTINTLASMQHNNEFVLQLHPPLQKAMALYAGITEVDLMDGLNYLSNGKGEIKKGVAQLCLSIQLINDPGFQLCQFLRLFHTVDKDYDLLYSQWFHQWLSSHPGELTDLRQLAQLMDSVGMRQEVIAGWVLESRWQDHCNSPGIKAIEVWSFFAENIAYLQEALQSTTNSITGTTDGFEQALYVLAQFPIIPDDLMQLIYQQAKSSCKIFGQKSRALLKEYGLIYGFLTDTLASNKPNERGLAIQWICDYDLKSEIPILKTVLRKENNDGVKVKILLALIKMGEKIDQYLSPKYQLDWAQSGLEKPQPENLAWFPYNETPKLQWADGQGIDPKIIHWWIVLACEFKDPAGNLLLDQYLSLLDMPSQKALSLFILKTFIERDILVPTDQEAYEYALKNRNKNLKTMLFFERWCKNPQDTLENAHCRTYQKEKSELLGSAIGEKGILALCGQVDAFEAVQLVSTFMREYKARRHQALAFLITLSKCRDPHIIQFLLSIARGYRQETVRNLAKELVTQIAVEKGWSQNQLIDRTIPTAGLDANSEFTLDYDSRQFTVKLDQNLKLFLLNENGMVIKALPAAKQTDDSETINRSKKEFSTSKKELKQVLEQQNNHLYQAMCAERIWPLAEWRQYFLQHPIMKFLIQKLIWTLQDEHGLVEYKVQFTAELQFKDIHGNIRDPLPNADIKLAHTSHIESSEAKAWLDALKQQNIKPLFLQFGQPKHDLKKTDLNQTLIDYHKGWMLEALMLKGVMTKRGYHRGEQLNGGYFNHYYKDFPDLGLRLNLIFSGNRLPEENINVVLYHSVFTEISSHMYQFESCQKKLTDIPQPLLIEAQLDFEAAAVKGRFFENWEEKLIIDVQ